MSSPAVIGDALQTTLSAALTGFSVAQTIEGINKLPCILIMPEEADWTVTFGRGTDTWHFGLYVMVSRGSERMARQTLDGLIAGAGSTSIRQILWNNPGIGLSDTQVIATGMRGYGGRFRAQGTEMMGAVITVCAYTSGTT